jgi:AcrR family transcriptional regulator
MIAANGLRSLKIRDVANAADCSVGSIYNEFGDFDGLILEISRGTVRALQARMSTIPDRDPVQQLYDFADGYLAFATEHGNLLRALFEHRMENDRPFPEDLLAMVLHTFALMYGPLVRLLPDRDPAEIALLARMMFSAVHGIISLGLEERLVAVPPESLRVLVRQFVKTHLIGIGVVARD